MSADFRELFQFSRYLVVGGATAALYFSLLIITIDIAGFQHFVAVSISYPLAISFHFFANKLFTFQSHSTKVGGEVFRYLCMASFNYLVTLLVLYLAVDLGGTSTFIGAALAVAVTVGLGYGLTKAWVFQRSGG